MAANQESDRQSQRGPLVSIIVPARNEAESLGHCLASLVSQSGASFEIIVVNDHSTDDTRTIAETYHMVQVIDADPLPEGWTGKNHAIHCGVKVARGDWFLFTDADTVHRHGALRRALREIDKHKVDLLSYSPKQELEGFWERALMPLVFAELRRQYPPSKVNSSRSTIAAANGQYLLISRVEYESIGGHDAIRGAILEDVELAKLVKSSGGRIRFRYGRDAVKTRMYRTFGQMWEGWTKNLALLFPWPILLALFRMVQGLLIVAGIAAVIVGAQKYSVPLIAGGLVVSLALAANFFYRVHKAHFGWINTIISPLGLPLFVLLLFNSRLHSLRGKVTWKGRTYDPAPKAGAAESKLEETPTSLIHQ